jgi:hypothetical protein
MSSTVAVYGVTTSRNGALHVGGSLTASTTRRCVHALANAGKQAKSLGQTGLGNFVHEPAIALAHGRLPSSRLAVLSSVIESRAATTRRPMLASAST